MTRADDGSTMTATRLFPLSERIESFIRTVATLGADEWVRVCRRVVETGEERTRAASDIISGILRTESGATRVLDRSRLVQEAATAYIEISRSLADLPLTLTDAAGRLIPLRGIAIRSATNAARALIIRDELMRTAAGIEARTVLLDPFLGLAREAGAPPESPES